MIFYPHIGYLGTEGSLSSMGRNFELWNLLHNYHSEVDLDFARMMWRFSGPPMPYATIDEAVRDYRGSQAKHWNGHICSPGNAMVGILQPDDGDEGLLHVSHGCAERVVHSPSATGGVVVRLNPTHSFFELKLAANPKEVASAAQVRARYDLWDANQKLAKLDYSDVQYAPLNQILNQAVTEWQKGWFYTDEAAETKGREEVVRWASAIRCHTRCQCYARQVQNALISPPNCPEDLGLQQWYGSWGEWALRNGHLVEER